MREPVEMKGLVESAEWKLVAGDSDPCMVYTVRVFRSDHKDENIVGHVVTLVKPERKDA